MNSCNPINPRGKEKPRQRQEGPVIDDPSGWHLQIDSAWTYRNSLYQPSTVSYVSYIYIYIYTWIGKDMIFLDHPHLGNDSGGILQIQKSWKITFSFLEGDPNSRFFPCQGVNVQMDELMDSYHCFRSIELDELDVFGTPWVTLARALVMPFLFVIGIQAINSWFVLFRFIDIYIYTHLHPNHIGILHNFLT